MLGGLYALSQFDHHTVTELRRAAVSEPYAMKRKARGKQPVTAS